MMNSDKLAKVLALAASDNEAEAIGALQAARKILAAEGLDFVDMANLLVPPDAEEVDEQVQELMAQLIELRRDARKLRMENRRLRGGGATPLADTSEERAAIERKLAQETSMRTRVESINAELTNYVRQLEEQVTGLGAQAEPQELRLLEMAAEVRKLEARALYLTDELKRSEVERFRLAALVRELSEFRSHHQRLRRPKDRAEQYNFFECVT